MKPMTEATKALTIFALEKLRLLSASKGKEAWPSWEMELASSTENGTVPVANKVTNSKCGPDSGMMPMRTAKSIIQGMLLLISASISK